MSYRITTDACSDLPFSYAEQNNIEALPLEYVMDGEAHVWSLKDNEKSHEFYDKIRAGASAKTTMINEETHREFFEKFAKAGESVLHIAFSSALSGTADAAIAAAKKVNEEYKDVKIIVVDSKCASLGEGLLVYKAAEKMKKGATIEENAAYVEDLKDKLVHMFTVEDLNHLYRGGRVSKMTAVFGTMLDIKPVLHVDDLGRLIAVGKVRKRRKSLEGLITAFTEKSKGFEAENDIFFVGHGDDEEAAKYVAEGVKAVSGINNYVIANIGAIIGAHSGPGTLALFFVGQPK